MITENVFGVFGYPLTHSFSKEYFTEKFRREGIGGCAYENFERKDARDIRELAAAHPDLHGLNVTIPHKQDVIPFLDSLSPIAESIGAVNCVNVLRYKNTFELLGFNTDVFGFKRSITPFLQPHHKRALILGTGGSSKAVAYVFKNAGIDFVFVSRNPTITDYTYDDLDRQKMNDFQIIVNCTPLGMHPNINSFPPIPYEHLSSHHLLFDLVYNPAETEFMRRGKARGATVSNGMEMLKYQAENSWEIWTGLDTKELP
jgi:shikimate dehydrogenase